MVDYVAERNLAVNLGWIGAAVSVVATVYGAGWWAGFALLGFCFFIQGVAADWLR